MRTLRNVSEGSGKEGRIGTRNYCRRGFFGGGGLTEGDNEGGVVGEVICRLSNVYNAC